MDSPIGEDGQPKATECAYRAAATGPASSSPVPTAEVVFGQRKETMVSLQAAQLGTRLDQDHLTETNGRMLMCRRCGAQVESPLGHHHLPSEGQLAWSVQWLDAQALPRHIERKRDRRATQ